MAYSIVDTWEPASRAFEPELAHQAWQRALAIDARAAWRAQAAGIGRLIGHPIAVVVVAVADLRRGRDFVNTDLDAAHASNDTRHALTLIGAALADVGQGLVDLGIAIVIEEITSFRSRPDASRTHDRAGLGIAHVDPRDAFADIASAGGTHGNLVIDDAVAIVVEPVAKLGARTDRTFTLKRSRGAACDSSHAFAGIVAARHSRFRIALVDASVAIIVESVAELAARIARAHADMGPRDTLHGPRSTLAHHAWATGSASSGVAFIDAAVAVIVQCITHLGAGAHAAGTHQRPRHALERAHSAFPDVAPARSSAPGVSLVRSRIAIVIDAITDLGRRSDAAHA